MRLAVWTAAMHLHTYRDESRSRHFDLIGGGSHPWTIDLVVVAVSAVLVLGFACALGALWAHYVAPQGGKRCPFTSHGKVMPSDTFNAIAARSAVRAAW
jgi:hypothetical protein